MEVHCAYINLILDIILWLWEVSTCCHLRTFAKFFEENEDGRRSR